MRWYIWAFIGLLALYFLSAILLGLFLTLRRFIEEWRNTRGKQPLCTEEHKLPENQTILPGEWFAIHRNAIIEALEQEREERQRDDKKEQPA